MSGNNIDEIVENLRQQILKQKEDFDAKLSEQKEDFDAKLSDQKAELVSKISEQKNELEDFKSFIDNVLDPRIKFWNEGESSSSKKSVTNNASISISSMNKH